MEQTIQEKVAAAASISTYHMDHLNMDKSPHYDIDIDTNPYLEIVNVDQSIRIGIFKSLLKLYEKRTFNRHLGIMDVVAEILKGGKAEIYDVDAMGILMKHLGFSHKKLIDGNIKVIEYAELRFERYMYFTKIKRARVLRKLNKQIVYIDERLINHYFKFEKVCTLGSLPDGSTIYFHAITNTGFVNGLFCNEASEEDFNKWVSNILLSHLKSPSLIIMDNGPLHGTPKDACPITIYSTKNEMLNWLTKNNIPCNATMMRPILYELIKQKRKDLKEYKIDKIFQSHGHEVLRLPHAFPDLNMTHFFWDHVRQSLMMDKTYPNIHNQNIQNKIRGEILPSISEKKWLELEKKLILKESDIFEIDTSIEEILEVYQFK